MKHDAFDDRILSELKNNGRITNLELAERVNLSPSACLRRVQEMERNGVIKGYRAVLDSSKLGNGFFAFVSIGLSIHTQEAQISFVAAMMQCEQVVECHNVTGSYEYFLRVETKDIKTYKAFHADVLGALPQVAKITTHIILESPKE